MRVVAQQHVFSNSYSIMCFLFINTSSRLVQKVGGDIAKMSEVIAVSQGIGTPDLFVNIRAQSLEHAHHIANTIGAIRGIKIIETNLCFRIHKFISNIGVLSSMRKRIPADPPSKDFDILGVLAQDGRQSNSEVARQLKLSEGSIRQRIKKMLHAGQMQFEVVCSPEALSIDTIAIVRLSTVANRTEDTIQQIVEIEDVTYVAQVSGNYNILLLVATTDTQTLANLCDNTFLAMRGVEKLSVQLLVAHLKHEYHVSYFEGQEDIPRRK